MQLKGIPFVQAEELHEDQFEELVEDLTKSELETIQNEIQEADKMFEEFLRASAIEISQPVTFINDDVVQIKQNTVNKMENIVEPTQTIEVVDNNTIYLVDPTATLLPTISRPYSETSQSDYIYVQSIVTEQPPQKTELMTANDPVYTATSWDEYEITLKRFRKEYDYVQTESSVVSYSSLEKRRGHDREGSTTTPYCFAF